MTIRQVCILAIIGVVLTLPSVASAANMDVECNASALIDAINTANQNHEADTLNLNHGCIYTLAAVNNTTDGSNGLPSIGSDIVIQGNGAIIRRSSAQSVPAFRVFHVAESGNLGIDRLTIRNGWAYNESSCEIDGWGGGILTTGSLTLTDSVLGSNQACHGGGIYSTGIMTLTNSLLSDNRAFVGDLPSQLNFGRGGGIYGSDSNQVLLLFSTIRGNRAKVNGGGIYNGNNSEVVVTSSTVSGNSAGHSGGGIYNLLLKGTERLLMNDSLVGDNSAGVNGGGIYNAENHNLVIVNSTVSSNNAQNGGGIYSESTGGIRLINSTVTGNSATGRIGGIYNGWSSMAHTSTITLTNTIVAAQALGRDCTFSAGVVSLGHNLDSDGSCVTQGVNEDMTNAAPALGPLTDNGGQTLTHALLDQSPAIDWGNDSDCPATDQRGVSRPQGVQCDIGSFEYGGNVAGSVPVLGINHSTGAPGSVFMLTSSGFPPSATVSISVNGIDLYILHTDPQGSVLFKLDTEGAGSGTFIVTVSAASSASVSFRIDPESPLQQSSGTGPTLRLPDDSVFAGKKELYLPMLAW